MTFINYLCPPSTFEHSTLGHFLFYYYPNSSRKSMPQIHSPSTLLHYWSAGIFPDSANHRDLLKTLIWKLVMQIKRWHMGSIMMRWATVTASLQKLQGCYQQHRVLCNQSERCSFVWLGPTVEVVVYPGESFCR